MTDSLRQSGSSGQRSPSSPAHPSAGSQRVTPWLGWVLFTGIMLVGAGVMNTIQGLTALLDPGFYRTATTDLLIDVNYTVWGWAFLITGATLVAAGFGLALGYALARVIGVVVAAVNVLVNLGFVHAYPTWAVIAVAFNVITIYALAVHGGEGSALRT